MHYYSQLPELLPFYFLANLHPLVNSLASWVCIRTVKTLLEEKSGCGTSFTLNFWWTQHNLETYVIFLLFFFFSTSLTCIYTYVCTYIIYLHHLSLWPCHPPYCSSPRPTHHPIVLSFFCCHQQDLLVKPPNYSFLHLSCHRPTPSCHY